jgi:hypothetical protein
MKMTKKYDWMKSARDIADYFTGKRTSRKREGGEKDD